MAKVVLDLSKVNAAKQTLMVDLSKKGVITPPQAEVKFVMDVSGSFDDEHRGGLTQRLLQRLVPWSLLLDPDQKMDMYTFSRGPSAAHRVGDITLKNLENYIEKSVINKVPGYGSGTDYSYVLEMVLQDSGYLPKTQKSGGFFSRAKTTQGPKQRSLILFVTDGASDDERRTYDMLKESEARGDQIYFQFIGVSNQGGTFPFLKKLGDDFGNTGLVVINNFEGFLASSDEQINGLMITDELLGWLKK